MGELLGLFFGCGCLSWRGDRSWIEVGKKLGTKRGRAGVLMYVHLRWYTGHMLSNTHVLRFVVR